MSGDELDQYERLIQVPDPDLYTWVSGEVAPPPEHDTALFRRLKAFYFDPAKTT
jgi:antitoxin CptB